MAGILPDGIDDAPAGTPQTRISIDGDNITIVDGPKGADEGESAFDDNLAEKLSAGDLSTIAADLLEGVEADIQYKAEFVANYNKGLEFLGISLAKQGTSRGGKRSTSKVYHPALQYACTKFQSAARAELLPSTGPCKVWNAGDETDIRNTLAEDLEEDLNWYLVSAAPEYYPDMDRGLYYLGYGGTLYKKIYRCPLRQRPVSDSVYLTELHISPEATSLGTAQRITHDIGDLTVDDIRVLIDLGVYREVELGMPQDDNNQVREQERVVSGKKPKITRSEDIPYQLYEVYTFLDLSQYGIKESGQPKAASLNVTRESTRLPLPYRITIEVNSRQVLEIRRNWKEDDDRFQRRTTFIEYAMIPGMGGMNYGYLHLLGNTVQALTALLRISIDAGMFSNFPGGVRSKGARTDTNEINPGPGEFVPIDAIADDVRKSIMPLPYKEPSMVILQMIQYLEGNIQKIIGSLEFAAGEGRTHIPEGTMAAMVEQQTQTMVAIHKRLHSSQQQELVTLKELFGEHPQDLVRMGNKSGRLWTVDMFNDFSLVPASDPNIPSQAHRVLQIQGLVELVKANPQFYNLMEVNRRALKGLGIADIDKLLQPAPQQPPPQNPAMEVARLQAEEQKQKQILEGQIRMKELAFESKDRQADRDSREKVAQVKLQADMMKLQHQDAKYTGTGIVPRKFAFGGVVQGFAAGGSIGDDPTGMLASMQELEQTTAVEGHVLATLADATRHLAQLVETLKAPRQLKRNLNGRVTEISHVS